MSQDSRMQPRLLGLAPQFLVDDLERSLEYYCECLGFQHDFTYGGFYAAVSRDGFAIHLKCAPKSQEDRNNRKDNEHLDAYVAVDGVSLLFEEFQNNGATVSQPLTERPWKMLDFYVEDPDGYILCFSEPVDDHE